MKMSSKRRRTKTQIEEDKEREKTEKDQLKAKLEEIKQWEKDRNTIENELNGALKVKQQVDGFFDSGLLKFDDKGDVQLVENPLERHVLKQEAVIRKSRQIADDYEEEQE